MSDRSPCPTCGSTSFCILAGERGAPMHPAPKLTYPAPRAPTLRDQRDRAVELLAEHSRHHVTLACNACGSSHGMPCDPGCPIGKLLAEVDKP